MDAVKLTRQGLAKDRGCGNTYRAEGVMNARDTRRVHVWAVAEVKVLGLLGEKADDDLISKRRRGPMLFWEEMKIDLAY